MRTIVNHGILTKLKKRKNQLYIFSIFFYTILVFFSGILVSRYRLLRPAYGFLITNVRVPYNFLRSLNNDKDQLNLDIKYKNFSKLEEQVSISSKLDFLYRSSDDWIPAKAKINENEYKVDLRLKGLLSDHWGPDKLWSYKLKVKEDEAIFGMKRFAIQHPRSRGYLNEWYFHKMLNHLGLINLRYDFIGLNINGKQYPIYALEENFDYRLIENNNRREGPIFKLKERINNNSEKNYEKKISFYEAKKYNSTREGKELLIKSENLIKEFLFGNKSAGEVFDLKLMAKAIAVTELFGSHHSVLTTNLRFYMNPVTGLIEPIPYDNNYVSLLEEKEEGLLGEQFLQRGSTKYSNNELNDSYQIIDNLDIFPRLFLDKEFSKAYGRALYLISNKKWLDNFFSEIKKEEKDSLKILQNSYPWYEFNKKDIFYKNQNFIKQKLNPKFSLVGNYELIETRGDNKFINLNIKNNHSLPIEILAIKNKINNQSINFANPLYLQNRPKICKETKNGKCLTEIRGVEIKNKFKINLKDKNLLENNFVVLEARTIGNEKKFEVNLAKFDNSIVINNLEKIKKLPYLNFQNQDITFKKGNWDISYKLRIPKGYNFIIPSGTHINLLNGGALISNSPISINGTKNSPVSIDSSDKSGEGLTVIQADGVSKISNLIFDNQRSLVSSNLNLTGAMTFYESDVELNKVFFSNNKSEDSLNIIRSKFQLNNSKFSNTFSDAIDVDFGNGNISNASFNQIGNDGIDVSGSNVDIDTVEMSYLGDKGISGGEGSNVNLKNININSALFGIASKDGTIIRGDKINIYNSNIGVGAYKKKPQYPYSSLKITNISVSNSSQEFLSETNSYVLINGKVIKENSSDVYNQLYK